MIKLTEQQLRAYARDLFRISLTSFADTEDSVVERFMQKVVEKHSVSSSVLWDGHSLTGANGVSVKMPEQQQHQRDLFDPVLYEQANEAESKL